MKILSLLKRSSKHPNFTEDFLFSYRLSDDLIIAAVMDGCSTAKESYFPATLYGKSLHKSCRMLPQMKEIIEDFDMAVMDLEAIADFMMNQLFDDLKKTKKLFFLNIEELLSTIVLVVYNKTTKQASIAMSGDGLFAVNGKVTEVDQNNIPNFLGYHLGKTYETIAVSEIQRWNFDEVNDIAIATDGIDKLRQDLNDPNEILELRDKFLTQTPKKIKTDYLNQQYQSFIEKGYIPYDDISVVRIINE